MVYLDNAATSFPRPDLVYTEMDYVNRNLSVNAGRGGYKAAKKASEIIAETKQEIAKLLHCEGTADVVLTASITQAMNQIIHGLKIDNTSVIYISPYEHNAVARTVEAVRKKTGCRVIILPLEKETLKMDLQRTQFMFHEAHPDIVISTVISNVTGYRLPIEKIFALAKEYEATTIADAAQAAGFIKIDYCMFNADIIAFAGHKTLCGPFGIGGFVIRKSFILDHVLTGGTGSDSLNLDMPKESPNRYEASSENVVAVAGLLAALKWLKDNPHENKIKGLTKYLINRLSDNNKVTMLGIQEDEIPCGIVSFVVDGYDSNDIGNILDEEFDVAVRTGYHCAPYIHDYLNDKDCAGTVRVGIGPFNTKQDIDDLVKGIESL